MKKVTVKPGEGRLPRKYPSMQPYKIGEEVIMNKAIFRSLKNGDLVECVSAKQPKVKKTKTKTDRTD